MFMRYIYTRGKLELMYLPPILRVL